MSRSLAVVGILTMIGVAGTWSAIGQDNTGQTSTGVVVKNHITDAERDRLMRKAMDDARAELETQKAATQAQEQQKAEIKKRAAEAETLAAETRREAAQNQAEQQKKQAAEAKKAADIKKAEEVRIANKLAEDEKNSSAQATAKVQSEAKSDIKNLDKVSPETSSKTAAASTKKEAVVTSSKASEPKGEETKSFYNESDAPKKEAASEKTVIETVSTKEPGSGITVKTTMPEGDDDRKAEQLAARSQNTSSRSGDQPDSRQGSESSGKSLSGQVVGMMRSTDGKPRILVNTEDRRMVQVILEDEDEAVPAPGAFVSVNGREVGDGNGRQVISARSVSIKSGQTMEPMSRQQSQPEEEQEAVISQQVSQAHFTLPGPMIMPGPMGILGGPPMPMMHGPGPMFAPPPPF